MKSVNCQCRVYLLIRDQSVIDTHYTIYVHTFNVQTRSVGMVICTRYIKLVLPVKHIGV